MWWILIILGLLIVFLAIILARTLAFKPPVVEAPLIVEVPVDGDKTAANLAQMIRCKTVSSLDESMVDKAAFEEFPRLLEQMYPKVHAA